MPLCYYRSPHSGTVDSNTDARMLHAAEPSLHDDDAHGLTADVEAASAAAVVEPSFHIETVVPPAVATQSAIYEEPGEDGRPVYRGFRDPKSQSQTFKKLQNLIESGEGKRVTAGSRFNIDRILTV